MLVCIAAMMASHYIVPFNDSPTERERELTRRLNRALCARATEESKGSTLAANNLGAGYPVETSDQLFALYLEGPDTDPEVLARKVVDHLYKKGLKQPYQDAVNLHVIAAKSFLKFRLPVFKTIGVEI